MLGGARPSGGRVGRCDPIPGGSPMRHVLRIAGRACIPALLSFVALDAGRPARAGVTREEVERAIRDGVRFLKAQQRADGSWPDVEGDARSGTTSLVTLALHDRRREGRFADDPPVARAAPQAPARGPAQHLRHRPPDHGLRRRRTRAGQAAHRRQRRLAGAGPDQARRPHLLARLVDLHRLQARQARRQLQYAVRPAGPARRQRGRRARQARGLGPGARLLGTQPEERRELGLHPRLARVEREHDLRRGLQPDHQRNAALPGAGIPPG